MPLVTPGGAGPGSRTGYQGNDFSELAAVVAELLEHQPAPLLEQVTTAIGGLGLVGDHVSERGFAQILADRDFPKGGSNSAYSSRRGRPKTSTRLNHVIGARPAVLQP
jgi:hypothetical protein